MFSDQNYIYPAVVADVRPTDMPKMSQDLANVRMLSGLYHFFLEL